VQVNADGWLEIDTVACRQLNLSETSVTGHMMALGLNVGRLRNQREAIWEALRDAFLVFANLPSEERRSALMATAAGRLLPDSAGTLAPFFTTTRSFFGPLAEHVLTEPPQSWI
jgi:hypothetical protein